MNRDGLALLLVTAWYIHFLLFAVALLYLGMRRLCRHNFLLQEDLDCICADKWQLRLNASKCDAFLISNKRKKISYDYFINRALFYPGNPL